MQAFTSLTGIVIPIDRAHVDTDAIIPKQFLKSIKRNGFGPYLFDDWRYLDTGEADMDCSDRPLNKDFVLNQPRYQGAQIMLARQNFGCGSSREHAPWALLDYGIRVVIAPSYADIFYNNCFKNGILPIILDESVVATLFDAVENNVGYELTVDLENQLIKSKTDQISFEIDNFRKHCLMNGLDDISLTLECADQIKAYEVKQREQMPWLFTS